MMNNKRFISKNISSTGRSISAEYLDNNIVYKGTDLLIKLTSIQIPDRAITRLSIQVYTDGVTNVLCQLVENGSDIVDIDGYVYAVITADRLSELNDGELFFTAVVGVDSSMYPDMIQDTVLEDTLGYTLKTPKVEIPIYTK